MARILITGGSGRLGRALQQVGPCCAPSHSQMDILDADSCRAAIKLYEPDIVIHCAGYVDATDAEVDRERCWALNVTGTRNVARTINRQRLVYISTDYVFDGELGHYSELDIPNPVNFYGLSKLAGELIVGEKPNVLILRAPFRADPPWPFDSAFIDQWTSCKFVSERAPDIMRAALSNVTGVLHLGGPRRSIYEMAVSVSPSVKKTVRRLAPVNLPRDTSLNSDKWNSLQGV